MTVENNPLLHRDLMLKSVFTFAVQLSLLYLLNVDPVQASVSIQSNIYLDTAKVLCSILLHYVMDEEIRVSIGMMRYSITHCDQFMNCDGNFTYPFLVATMKGSAAVFTQIVQIYKMLYVSDTETVAKDFVAFVVISQIDDIVGMSLKQYNIDKEMEQHIYVKNKDDSIDLRSIMNKFENRFICGNLM